MKLDFRPTTFDGRYNTLTACVGFVPTDAGYVVSPIANPYFDTALADDCLGARAIKVESGSIRLFAGSASKIQEFVPATGWVDRSKAGGYSTGSNRWWFSPGLQYSEVIATNYADTIQRSTGTGFTNLTNAPKAKIVVAQTNALLALYYDTGSGAVPNGIITCTRGDPTVWTPADDNDATSLKLVETPGEIVAGATLHDIVVVWKKSSMYVGRFVGGEEKWQFNLLSPNVGCYGQEAWCNTPAGIVFTGEAGTYLFDGSVPRPIDQGVRASIQDKMNSTNSWGANVSLVNDDVMGAVFIYIPSPTANEENNNARFSCYAYNYRTEKWSQPYPYYNNGSDRLGSDWGYKSSSTNAEYTGFQAAVRDFSNIDASRLKTGWSTFEQIGHFVIPSQKHILAMNGIIASNDTLVSNVEARIRTGVFQALDSWANEGTLRRVGLVRTNNAFKIGYPALGSNFYCTVSSINRAEVSPMGQYSTTFTWSSSDARFDGFATGKAFYVTFGSKNERFALHDVWFEMGLAGKT